MLRTQQQHAGPFRKHDHTALFAAVAAVAGSWFAFANPVFRFPGLILLYPACLTLLGLRSPSFGPAFRAGWLTGAAAALGSLYWAAVPVHDFGRLHWVLAAPTPALMALFLGLYPGLFAGLVQAYGKRLSPTAFGLFAGCLWMVLETARGTVFTGFPWLVPAAALSPWPAAVQGAAVVGAYGLSGLLAAFTAWIVSGRLLSRSTLLGLLGLAGLAAYGQYALQAPATPEATLSVAVVQGNINQDQKWDPEYQAATVMRYVDLSRKAVAGSKTDLVVWPETAMPFYFQRPDALQARVREFARDHNTALVTGAPAAAKENGAWTLFNRAYLTAPDGVVTAFYDKEHLVPFGEYVPLSRLLPFMRKLVQGAGDFREGDNKTPLQTGNLALGMLICYEGIFPELAQKRVAEGANLLVNITNDAWFGDTPAPRQHLDATLLRAVEQGRWLVRAANTGISAVIDPKGRILAHGRLFTAESVSSPEVGLVTEMTVFHRIKTGLDWGVGLLLAGFLVYGAAVPKKEDAVKRLA